MVAAIQIKEAVQKRLSMQVEGIAENTTTLRSQDWDRDRFDIEFGLQNGTTYNSFIIQGEKTALVDTSHAKFRE
ncbi:MAG: diflavin flavoprotein A, partial [Cyanobacteria bacterium J06598_3]